MPKNRKAIRQKQISPETMKNFHESCPTYSIVLGNRRPVLECAEIEQSLVVVGQFHSSDRSILVDVESNFSKEGGALWQKVRSQEIDVTS